MFKQAQKIEVRFFLKLKKFASLTKSVLPVALSEIELITFVSLFLSLRRTMR